MCDHAYNRRWLHGQCPYVDSHENCPRCSRSELSVSVSSQLPPLPPQPPPTALRSKSYSRRWIHKDALNSTWSPQKKVSWDDSGIDLLESSSRELSKSMQWPWSQEYNLESSFTSAINNDDGKFAQADERLVMNGRNTTKVLHHHQHRHHHQHVANMWKWNGFAFILTLLLSFLVLLPCPSE